MAPPVTARFGKFTVSLSDGGTPETFVAPCGFTSKSLVLGKNLSEIAIPDCDDPDLAPWLGRDVSSKTASVTGEGVLAASALPLWQAAFDNDESIRAEVEIQFSTGAQTYVGAFHLENMTLGAERDGGRVTINVSMQSDGELVPLWTPA
ncbi:MAG: phage tail tube protein [Parvibaculaceae bacterium]